MTFKAIRHHFRLEKSVVEESNVGEYGASYKRDANAVYQVKLCFVMLLLGDFGEKTRKIHR